MYRAAFQNDDRGESLGTRTLRNKRLYELGDHEFFIGSHHSDGDTACIGGDEGAAVGISGGIRIQAKKNERDAHATGHYQAHFQFRISGISGSSGFCAGSERFEHPQLDFQGMAPKSKLKTPATSLPAQEPDEPEIAYLWKTLRRPLLPAEPKPSGVMFTMKPLLLPISS